MPLHGGGLPDRVRQDQPRHGGADHSGLEGRDDRRRHLLDEVRPRRASGAINPESGLFGVAPGTGARTNPNAIAALSHDTIFTNVAAPTRATSGGRVSATSPPAHLIDWRGRTGRPRPPPGRASQQPLHRRAPRSPRSPPNGTIPTGSRSRPSSSAGAAPRSPRWSPRRSTGRMGSSWAPSWRRRPPRQPPEPSAPLRRDPSPCCPSAAITWATTSPTGWRRGNRPNQSPAEDLLCQLVPQDERAGSSGPASARTPACWPGSIDAVAAGGRRRDPHRTRSHAGCDQHPGPRLDRGDDAKAA